MLAIIGKNKSKVWPISKSQDVDHGTHNGIHITTNDIVTNTATNSLNSACSSFGTTAKSSDAQFNYFNQVNKNTEKKHDYTNIAASVSFKNTKATQDFKKLRRLFQYSSTINDLEMSRGNYKKIRGLSDATKSNMLIKADILFVAGGITTLIGFMVAAMGIYPRNQVGIRIYLEIFGCLMVVAGVVMILFGIRSRSLENNTLVSLDNLSGDACQTQINQSSTIVRPELIKHQRLNVQSIDDRSAEMDFKIDHYPIISRKDYESLLGPSQATVSDGLSAVLTVSTLIAVRKNISWHFCLHHVAEVSFY